MNFWCDDLLLFLFATQQKSDKNQKTQTQTQKNVPTNQNELKCRYLRYKRSRITKDIHYNKQSTNMYSYVNKPCIILRMHRPKVVCIFTVLRD